METQLREQKEAYGSQLEALVFKNEHLNKENEQLQALFQEKSNVNQSIGQEVARLTAENMVECIYEACMFVYSHSLKSPGGDGGFLCAGDSRTEAAGVRTEPPQTRA